MLTTLGLMLAVIPAIAPETPNRQPQMAVSGNNVALVFGSGHTVLFAKSADGGATFSKPESIAELPVLPLGRHRGPRVAYAGRAILVTAIGGQKAATGPHAHGLPADGDLSLWRSVDGGVTWLAPVTLNDVQAAAREGLHAMTADAQGNAAAVWLDLRGKGTRLYATVSRDGGASWSPNFAVYESPEETICECCHPSLAAMGNGEFAVMFRNALGGNRDMYLARIAGASVKEPARKLGHGSWPLKACPMDGGGLSAEAGNIVTAWRRDQEVFLAKPGQPESRLGEGKDVALTTSGAHTFAVWTAGGGIQSWISGETSTLSAAGAFPSIVPLNGGKALAAWEEAGSLKLRVLEPAAP